MPLPPAGDFVAIATFNSLGLRPWALRLIGVSSEFSQHGRKQSNVFSIPHNAFLNTFGDQGETWVDVFFVELAYPRLQWPVFVTIL